MNIAIIGYGKMGKAIEQLATQKQHKIVLKIDDSNIEDFTEENLKKADVAIEFSTPDAAFENIKKCINYGVPVVSGTTAWLDKFHLIEQICQDKKAAFFYSSNFSIGVNILFKLNKTLSNIMNQFTDYEVVVDETHHIHKLDAPSGTAITIAQDIIKNIDRKTDWIREKQSDNSQIVIKSHREGEHAGEHIVRYESDIDTIEIRHSAKSRQGLAMGALMAAEFIIGKSGVFGMDDLLQL